MNKPKIKSGFAVLVGRSNVGKSTLLNSLVGTKVAIVTPKPQTTRNTIHGIYHDDRGQIVFVDTPGYFKKPKDLLTKKLIKTVLKSFEGIDIIVYVVDPSRGIGEEEKAIMAILEKIKLPKILAINKTDLPKERIPYIIDYENLKGFDNTFKISALNSTHLKDLINIIFDNFPEQERFYPEGQFTNIENRFWFAELIREKAFIALKQEIPYNVNVEVEDIEQKGNLLKITARIITSEKRHKSMIIGKGGQMLKRIGMRARKEIEQVTDMKVYLDLEVQVEKWQERF